MLLCINWCYMFSNIVVQDFRICLNNVIVIYILLLNLGRVNIKYKELNMYKKFIFCLDGIYLFKFGILVFYFFFIMKNNSIVRFFIYNFM